MRIERVERRVLGRRASLLHAGGTGPPDLILLHGIPTNAELWRPVLEALGGEFRAIAPNLPGFGGSAAPLNPSIGAYHRFITRLAAGEGIARPVLVGHDLGGLYALTYALAHPGRLRALVLLNTTIYPDPLVALGLMPLLMPGFGEAYAWLAGRERYWDLMQRDLLTMYPQGTPEPLLRQLTEPYVRTQSWLSLVRALRGLNPFRVLRWKPKMRSLELPVLILWGEHDPYFPASVPERLHNDLPNSRLTYVSGGGHFHMLSHPDEPAAAIQRFVQDVESG